MEKTRASSIFTFFYKFIVPTILVVLLIIFNLLIKEKTTRADLIGINLIYIFFFFIGYLPLLNIKKVFYDTQNIYTSNFLTEKEYKLESVVGVKRWLLFFYKLHLDETEKNKKIKFFPREFGNLSYLLKKPISVIELEKLVEKRK